MPMTTTAKAVVVGIDVFEAEEGDAEFTPGSTVHHVLAVAQPAQEELSETTVSDSHGNLTTVIVSMFYEGDECPWKEDQVVAVTAYAA